MQPLQTEFEDRLFRYTQIERQGEDPVGRQVWEPLCAALQRFDPARAFRVLD